MRIFLLLVAFLFASWLGAQPAMSLEQVIAFAQDNHHQVRLARLNIEDAAAQITERRAFGIPQLNADVGYTRFLALPVTILPPEFGLDPATGQPNPDFDREVRFGLKNNLTGTLALRSMIFDPSYFVGLRAARTYRDYTAQELQAVQRETRHQVIESFLPVLLVNEQILNLDDNLANLQRLRNEAAALHEEGFAELLDVERLDLSIFTLRTERESVLSQRDNLLHYLKMTMGYPMDKDLEVQGSLDELLVRAAQQNLQGSPDYQAWPEYRVAQQGLELARLNVRLNKFGYMPSLDAFANVQRMYMGDTFSDGVWANAALAGVGLKVPLFDGLLTHARIQRAEVTRKNSEVQIEQLRQQIDLSIQNARNNYRTMQERLRNQERNLALAEKIYQTTRTKYREGVGSSLEINQAEQALFTAQRQHIQARYDLIQALFRLEKASGK
jgi:outer membrane protein